MASNSAGDKNSSPVIADASKIDEPKPEPQIDPMLNESENILEDYISDLSANRTLIAK
jgi:hypothetical protein